MKPVWPMSVVYYANVKTVWIQTMFRQTRERRKKLKYISNQKS